MLYLDACIPNCLIMAFLSFFRDFFFLSLFILQLNVGLRTNNEFLDDMASLP